MTSHPWTVTGSVRAAGDETPAEDHLPDRLIRPLDPLEQQLYRLCADHARYRGDRSRFTGQRVDATTTEVPTRDGKGLIATARRV